MTVARILGVVTNGVLGMLVTVEVDVAQGLPSVGVVGLAGASVLESRSRVRSAITNSGMAWPASRITIGLSPADVPKTGTGLDLAIAVGILHATQQIPAPGSAVIIGELGLDGVVRPVPDALCAAITASRAGVAEVFVAADCAGQVGAVPGIRTIAITDLAHLVAVLRDGAAGARVPQRASMPADDAPDLADVRGHAVARLGLEAAAVGGHHLSLVGPPGVGKSMLGLRLATALPDLDDAAALEVTSLLSITGQLDPRAGIIRRPVTQAPHHAISAAAFLGSAAGTRIRAGALTAAHRGVLFLDEAPEFNRQCLEGLRQPLETGVIPIARVGAAVRLPADFQLILAANPCPCGLSAGRGEACTCTAAMRRRYAERLSGPLMDRIDIRLRVSRPSTADLAEPGESSVVVRSRVNAARERAAARFAAEPWSLNAHITTRALRSAYRPTPAASDLLESALGEGLSLRGGDRVLRVAWSLADLHGLPRPGPDEVGMALALREGT